MSYMVVPLTTSVVAANCGVPVNATTGRISVTALAPCESVGTANSRELGPLERVEAGSAVKYTVEANAVRVTVPVAVVVMLEVI
jgi:hypothetical protein